MFPARAWQSKLTLEHRLTGLDLRFCATSSAGENHPEMLLSAPDIAGIKHETSPNPSLGIQLISRQSPQN